MAILIRDSDTDRMIRELAERTGEPITEAVRLSVAERLQRIPCSDGEIARRKRRIREITDHLDSLPRSDEDLSDEDIVGFGRSGVPA